MHPGTAAAARPRRLCIESLEDRRVLAAGVTVITHGAQFFAGLPDWTVTMGQAILDRADGADTSRTTGSLLQHDPTSGAWRAVGDAAWVNSNSLDDHIVLLYDWSSESGTLADGWLEAAADNLFASLLAANDNLDGDLQGTSFFDAALGAGGGSGLLNLHLIGHSRGGVVNSLVAERFDAYFGELTVDHVTSLDPHPAGPMNDPGYAADNPSANSRIFTYDNVRFADNYFQSDGSYEPLLPPDFDGVLAEGAYNFQIPSTVIENGGGTLEHSDVHTWYFGTITEPFDANYAGFSEAGRNNDGDVSFPESWWGANGVPFRTSTGFAFSAIAAGSRDSLPITGAKQATDGVPTVVDGDASFGSDGLFSDSLPAWEEHGGGGTGPLGGGGDLYVELNAGGDDYYRRHNPLYFPRHTVAVEYDYWITDDDSAGLDDVLQVIVGGALIDQLPLDATSGGFVANRRAVFWLPIGGLAATLEFRIADLAEDGIDAAVRFDNVELVIQPPAASADFDGDGRATGNDFVRWQSGLGTFVTAAFEMGDADQDGNVLADDLAVWRQQAGANMMIAIAPSFGTDFGASLADLAFAVDPNSGASRGDAGDAEKRSVTGRASSEPSASPATNAIVASAGLQHPPRSRQIAGDSALHGGGNRSNSLVALRLSRALARDAVFADLAG